MSDYGTKLAEGFSSKVMQQMYDRNLLDSIVNRNYEGEINAIGSLLNVLDFAKLSEKTYADAALTADSLTENNGALTIDQYKSFYWKEKTLAKWLSYIKNPHPYIVTQVANERSKNMDSFVFGLYPDIGAGNRVGTDVTTGTVTVDVTSAYTGGAIAATATFTVEADTPIAITAANILNKIATLKQKLDLAEKNGYSTVPDADRFAVLPPEFFTILTQGTGVVLHVDEAYQDLVKKGYMGELQSFRLFKSNRLTGNNTDGYHCIAGHKNWVTFAEKVLDARMEEDLIGDFGTAYKDLFVYGAKVKDIQRHQAAELFATF